jgi:hypothetical protein
MEVGRAFGVPFKDVRWFSKAAWAGLWTALLVTIPAVTGYSLDYIRNVANGYETPLPEWTGQFGRYWVRGFLLSVALFIYFIPAWILLFIGYLPVIGMSAVANSQDAINAAAGLGGTTVCITSVLAIIYIIVVSIFSQAAVTHFALHEEFSSLFQVKEIIARLRTNSGYFTAWIMSLVIYAGIGVVAGAIGSILGLIIIGLPFAGFAGGVIGFVGLVMTSHLYGQYAAKAYGLPGLAPMMVAYAAPQPYAPPQSPQYAPPAPPQYAPPAPPAYQPPPSPPAYAPPAPPQYPPQQYAPPAPPAYQPPPAPPQYAPPAPPAYQPPPAPPMAPPTAPPVTPAPEPPAPEPPAAPPAE